MKVAYRCHNTEPDTEGYCAQYNKKRVDQHKVTKRPCTAVGSSHGIYCTLDDIDQMDALETGTTLPTNRRRYFHLFSWQKRHHILIQILLKFVPKGPIHNKPSLFQVMAWHHTGSKPLSLPVMTQLTAIGNLL